MPTHYEKCLITKEVTKSRANLRRYAKSMELGKDDLERFAQRILVIVEEMKQEEELELQEKREKAARIDKVKQQMEEHGLCFEDLIEAFEVGQSRKEHSTRARVSEIGIYEYPVKGKKVRVEAPVLGRITGEFGEFLKKSGKKRKEFLVELKKD